MLYADKLILTRLSVGKSAILSVCACTIFVNSSKYYLVSGKEETIFVNNIGSYLKNNS